MSGGVRWGVGKRGESRPMVDYGGDRLIPARGEREGKTMTDTTRSIDHGAEARKHLEVAAREVSLEMAAAAQSAAQAHALLAVAGEIRALREGYEATATQCLHGTVGLCMLCLQDSIRGLR